MLMGSVVEADTKQSDERLGNRRMPGMPENATASLSCTRFKRKCLLLATADEVIE
jgi:hypothetical protein